MLELDRIRWLKKRKLLQNAMIEISEKAETTEKTSKSRIFLLKAEGLATLFMTVQLVIHSIRLPLKLECMKYNTFKFKKVLLNKLLFHEKN